MKKKMLWIGIIVLSLIILYFLIPVIKYLPNSDIQTTTEFMSELYDLIPTTIAEEYDAATYYKQADDILITADFESVCSSMKCPPNIPWNSDEFPELALWLDDHSLVYDLIRTGSEQEDCLRNIGEIEEISIIPIEDYPAELFDFLLSHIGYKLGTLKSDDEAVSEIYAALHVLKHMKESGSLVRAVSSLSMEIKLHEILQADLKGKTRSPEFYNGIIHSFDMMLKFQHDPIMRNYIFEVGLHRLSYYEDLHHPVCTDLTFWDRTGDILKWRWNTTFDNPDHELEISDKWYQMLFEQWKEPYYSPRYRELRNLINEYTRTHKQIGKFFDLSNQAIRLLEIRNATILLAALRWYESEKHYWPVNLKELVPDYLQTLPIDPNTGSDWVYKIEKNNLKLSVQTIDSLKTMISMDLN